MKINKVTKQRLAAVGMILLAILSYSVAAAGQKSTSLPPQTFSNIKDFTFSYWQQGYFNKNTNLHTETSHYALSFDAKSLQLNYLIPLTEREEFSAFKSPFKPSTIPEQSTTFYLKQDGKTYNLSGMSGNTKANSRLVEGGKFYQRRIFTPLNWQANTPAITETDIEVQTWPDRMSLLLRIIPTQTLVNSELGVDINLGLLNAKILTPEKAMDANNLIALHDDKQSFVIENTNSNARISYQEKSNNVHLQLNQNKFIAGKEITISFSIYPKKTQNAVNHFKTIQSQVNQPVGVTAQRIVNSQIEGKPALIENIASHYDKPLGAVVLEMPTLVKDNLWANQEQKNELFERVKIEFINNSNTDKQVRILLKGDNEPQTRVAEVGFSANFTDAANTPVGVPIQISKNWHGLELGRAPQRYNGKWVHLFSMITVPAKSTTSLKLASAKGHYGGTASAVHQQLSLIGWGSNQLWDISTLGTWGESICYAPDQAQRGSSILDVRPVYSLSKKGKKWSFGRNVGAGDFLRYYPKGQIDQKGRPLKIPHGNMRAYYKRVSPVMTEVTYGGSLADNSIDLQYTTSIYRTDDLVRGIYHFRYDVQEDIDFDRLVLFQVGADNYNENNDKKFAYGNEHGLISEWQTKTGGDNNHTPVTALTGETPWISLHDPAPSTGFSSRGIIIRDYNAVINGKAQNTPHFVERGSVIRWKDPSKNKDIVIADMVLPENTNSLKKGDYIEAVVEYVVFPGKAEFYYGVNEPLKKALARDANSWKMSYREVVSNTVDVNVTKGKLIRNRPIFINADNNQAQFTLTNGLGYVPFTIGNLAGYQQPILQQKVGKHWLTVDQSVHGKDYWQTDFNPNNGKWEITYSVPVLDNLPQEQKQIEFRFKLNVTQD